MSLDLKQKEVFCIVEFSREDYSKYYVTEALFKLMESTPFDEITVSEISGKAGVGRATFYRYFSCKEDVIRYFFKRTGSEFSSEQIYRPRCAEDYEDIIKRVIGYIKKYQRRLKLLSRSRLEYIYFDFVDSALTAHFTGELSNDNPYQAAGYAGAICNITLRWVANGCKDDESVIFDAFRAVTLGKQSG